MATANTGLVANLVSSLSCVLKVNTRQGTGTTTEWFTQTIATDVDGGSSETSWSVFDSFWARPMTGVYTFGQSAQSAAAVMNAGATSGAGVDVTAYVQLSPSDVLDQDPLVAGTDVGIALKYRQFPWDDTAMTIGDADPYAAAQSLSFSAFGHSTASPLATTRVTPAYLKPHSTAGDWTDTSTVGVGAMFTLLDDPAYW
jgi:hypothetical protein